MSELLLLSERQMGRLLPFFPLSYGVPRVDDRRVISGIIYVIKHGLQWKDAPKAYGPHKTFYNRFVRWSLLGVFDRIFKALASEGAKAERIMIDATHLKEHRTAAFAAGGEEAAEGVVSSVPPFGLAFEVHKIGMSRLAA